MISSSAGNQLSYDAFNEQILDNGTGAGSEVVFDPWGKAVSLWEVNAINQLQGSFEINATAYWGSTPIESYLPGSASSHFRYRDWVGSLRLETDAQGNVSNSRVNLPFGDGTANLSGSRDGSFDGFAGYWDGSTGATNHAPFREYSNLAGRWQSPDPYDGSYDAGNPQSFNRYSYALNNPLTFTDPSGQDIPDCGEDFCEGGGGGGGDPTGGGGDPRPCIANCGGGTPPPNDPGPAPPPPPPDPNLFPGGCIGTCGPTPPQTPSGPTGGGGGGAPKKPMTHMCMGTARVLQGNAATIGKPGGFSGSSVGNFPVTANGAAIIPSQFGMSKAALRPYIGQISGVFPSAGISFMGLVDTIGSTDIPNVQAFLMNANPGLLIVELPGATKDYGKIAVTLTLPTAVGCPAGTVMVTVP